MAGAPTARQRPRRAGGVSRVAAIDIGSNSIRQIVADVSAGGVIRVVDEMKAAPRLGAGVTETGALSASSMSAALVALGRMAALARQIGAERIEAVATSAVREASNGAEFLALVREETGLHARVLSGEEEARYSFQSALAHFELGVGRAVVMDIGGGSLELAMSADGLVDRLASLPLGAIRLTEEFLRPEPRRKSVGELRRLVRKEIRRALPVGEWRRATLIGSGGTFTNLASMLLARAGVPTARTTHGTRVSRVDLEHLLDGLQEMSADERMEVPGLNPARADIIVAGLAVAAEVMARIDARELLVSSYGIREGLLLETARVRPIVADPGEARARSVLAFAERAQFDAPHSKHVQRLALQLFDAIGERVGCEPDDRAILSDAALLHDVGYYINYEKHHKHSYHLILHGDFLGMTPTEQVAIANIARYHRGARPKKKHRNFGGLDAALRAQIERLSAILRVADGFDRGHSQTVASIEASWEDDGVRLTPVPASKKHPMRLELWGASRKAALLERVTGQPVRIIAPDGTVVVASDD